MTSNYHRSFDKLINQKSLQKLNTTQIQISDELDYIFHTHY